MMWYGQGVFLRKLPCLVRYDYVVWMLVRTFIALAVWTA